MPREPLIVPREAAILMMECQKGVLDPTGPFGALGRRAEEKGMVGAVHKLLTAFRETGRTVVHCLAHTRPDGKGRSKNAPLFQRSGEGLVLGSEKVDLVSPLTIAESDLVVPRYHGVSPFHGTELNALLRNLGVTTIVATGVSTNVGITGMVIEAVNEGYEVLLPTDAVAGVPPEYEELQIKFTLRNLARLTTSDEICQASTK